MTQGVNRRQVLGGAFASALGLGVAGCGGGSGSGTTSGGQVVVANYGGPFAAAMKSVYFDTFTAETGINVVQVPADIARYVSMAQAGRSEWDTLDADGFSVVDWVHKGIVQKLSADVPQSDLVDAAYRDYTAGGYTQSFLMAYRKSAVGATPPETWEDFFDIKKYPGKRGWPSGNAATVEVALLADGVAAADLFPLDFDRGFAKLDTLRDHLTIYDSYSAIAQGLQARSVDMILIPNGRAVVLSDQDPDIVVQWNQNIWYPWTGYTVPNGAPNAKGMNELLAWMQDPKRQAELAKKSYYGPTVRSAYDYLPADVLAKLPGSDAHVAVAAPVKVELLSSQTDEYVRRYTEWIAK